MLDVPVDATAKQVRRAYKRLARLVHPDTNPTTGSSERFMAVKAAHDDMLRRIDSGGSTPRPSPEIRPEARDTRAMDPMPWDLQTQVIARRELGRTALYAGSALLWFFLLWVLVTSLQRGFTPRPAPPEEPEPIQHRH